MVWLIAVFAFQMFLKPEGLTESDLGELEQRIRWPLYAPVMAAIGFAQAFTWPRGVTETATFAAAVCFLVHAIYTMTRNRLWVFVLMICIQAVFLAIAVIYFIRFSRFHTSG